MLIYKVYNLLNKSLLKATILTKTLSTYDKSKLIEAFRAMAPDHREEPIIKKIESQIFKDLFTTELTSLSDLFTKHGYEIRIAGGAVRDILSGKAPKDLDFATTATPEQMKEMFTNENIRMINMNGEKHGTITPRINDKENFEVTTLRIDVSTDGRHAEVEYTTDWLLDANRRDLTINSMFLDFDGNVYDYFYGYNDLNARKIRFVGDATKRIREDYLRILRYFRIAETSDNHEPDTIQAIKDNGHGLAGISGERIWTELKKILEGNFAVELLKLILKCNLSKYIGITSNFNLNELRRITPTTKQYNLEAVTLLASILNSMEDAQMLHMRIKLSAYERDLLYFIIQHREPKPHPNPLKPYQMLVVNGKSKNITPYIIEVLKYNNSTTLLNDFSSWTLPPFPINGRLLKEAGVDAGKLMGQVMDCLRRQWAESDFQLTERELIAKIPEVVCDLNERKRAIKSSS